MYLQTSTNQYCWNDYTEKLTVAQIKIHSTFGTYVTQKLQIFS